MAGRNRFLDWKDPAARSTQGPNSPFRRGLFVVRRNYETETKRTILSAADRCDSIDSQEAQRGAEAGIGGRAGGLDRDRTVGFPRARSHEGRRQALGHHLVPPRTSRRAQSASAERSKARTHRSFRDAVPRSSEPTRATP